MRRDQARNQLGTPRGRRVFQERPKFFELCPIFLHTEAKLISPKQRETLTEPHYMFCGTLGFCGTPVEDHCYRMRMSHLSESSNAAIILLEWRD